MKSSTAARILLIGVIAAGFSFAGWQLMKTAPQSKRERPAAPTPLVDVIDSQPRSYPLTLEASGPVTSAFELEIRPQVGGRIVEMHPDFAPGGSIPTGATIVQVDTADYRLAVAEAEAEVAKARATIALEQGRRVVAREELESLQGSIKIDASSQALALRKPQLRQVEAELAAAENQLQRARLDLERTRISLPYDVVVLERTRVSGEVVAARELIGRVTRADEYWVELRTGQQMLPRLRARSPQRPGSAVTVRSAAGSHTGEVIRIRADLAAGSRMAGVIAAVPLDAATRAKLLLGSYVEAEIAAGDMDDVIAVPRRAVRDNDRVWVVDGDGRLQVRTARIRWESGQRLLLDPGSMQPGDTVVVSRIAGLVPGTPVRVRTVDPVSGEALAMQPGVTARD